MELKVNLGVRNESYLINHVPNHPCGVESSLFFQIARPQKEGVPNHPCGVETSVSVGALSAERDGFLIIRVELKPTKLRGIDFIRRLTSVLNHPCGVETYKKGRDMGVW